MGTLESKTWSTKLPFPKKTEDSRVERKDELQSCELNVPTAWGTAPVGPTDGWLQKTARLLLAFIPFWPHCFSIYDQPTSP